MNIKFNFLTYKKIDFFAITLGEALRKFRLKNCILQKQMAYMLEITTEYYCKIENDKILPSKNMLIKICKMTGMIFEVKDEKILVKNIGKGAFKNFYLYFGKPIS